VGEQLGLAHRAFVEPLLRKFDSPLSEYSFANLFLFREVHQYSLMTDPLPHVLGRTYDGVRHAMPLWPIQPTEVPLLLGSAECIYPVAEDLAKAAVSHGLVARWNDDDSDYIFDTQKLASLEGKVLRGKRAQAKAFASEHNPSVTELAADNLGEAFQVLKLWGRQVDRPRGDTDYAACEDALNHFAALDLHGILIHSGTQRQPTGFLLAQRLGSDSTAVHFAKGDRASPGVYPYLFSQYAARSHSARLNFEQDLGKPGLRRAKRALDPDRMQRKYRLFGEGK
jgi:hypothetical protein